jgi:ATP phosphoribosyltransferase regulatory subunit
MTEPHERTLLPAGMADVLPPQAAFEADTVERLMANFASYGYERVKPPLIEFEETLLSGSGAALADQSFRLMDPISQRMLGLRPDMTVQIARIATTRLAHWPRPLRLSYSGQVVRVLGSQLRPQRQLGQVGAEIVGANSAAADTEVIIMAATTLADLGAKGLSVDLGLPTLVPAVLPPASCAEATRQRLRTALDRKDAAAVSELAPAVGEETARLLADVVAAAGSPDGTVRVLLAADLPPRAAEERTNLIEVLERVRRGAPWLEVSIDVVEYRGLEYHSGVTFSLFARHVRGELGRGGRYLASENESATGVTLFLDTVLEGIPRPAPPRRVYVPANEEPEGALRLREAGWITVLGLEHPRDVESEAARLRCGHVLIDGVVREVRLRPGQRRT